MKRSSLIMGILNLTPDSFSDGGRYHTHEDAVNAALDMVANGAQIIDVGGESTRPGSRRLQADEEIGRIRDVVAELVDHDIVVSIDTLHADTARAMVDVGAQIINDVSGGLYDPLMPQVIAQSQVAFICQHWRGTPDTMDQLTDYDSYGGVVPGVIAELRERINVFLDAGVDPKNIIADPGLGFAKTPAQSWEILRNLDTLAKELPYPILIGQSRKRFLAEACGDDWEGRRDTVTALISAWCSTHDMWAVRVHNVPATKAAIDAITLMSPTPLQRPDLKGGINP